MSEIGNDRVAVAPDNPGYGESDPPPRPPTIDDLAGAIGDVIDGLGLGEVDVLGYHTGSSVAVALARQRPSVRNVILVGAAALTAEEVKNSAWLLKPITFDPDGKVFVDTWRGIQKWAGPGYTLEMLGRQFPYYLMRPETRWYAFGAVFGYDLFDALPKLDQSVLLLITNDDLLVQTRRLAPYVRNGKVVERMDWGIGFHEVWPIEAAALVRGFLDGVR
jgi:pimeloyl-ACP methyl ester carboxylesterase